MVEDKEGTTAVAEEPKTEAQLMAEMTAATKAGDFKQVAKVAQELVKFQKAKEAAELAEKQKVLESKTQMVLDAIRKALKPLVEAGELDQADGVWFTQDFAEKLETCRLMKNAPRKSGGGGGGGGGKKFNVGTTELLEKFGEEEYKDGLTYNAAWASNTDKNYRYGIREALLKKSGMTS